MLTEVYDIETLRNLFTYTGYCRNDKTYHQFIIHNSQNDFVDFIKHLYRDKLVMVGFNNLAFDYPVLHHMINHYDEYLRLNGDDLAQKIYEKSQELIHMEFSTVADWNIKIKQLDLFKLWHFDNPAKSTSLKSLEIAMNFPNVEDMPFEHDHWCTTEEIPKILSYNKNDVEATNMFLDITLGNTEHEFYKGKNKIELRQSLAKNYNLPCLSWNDIKTGVELILKLYCQKFNQDPKVIRKLRTPRSTINLNECLPKWTHFESKEFKKLENDFRNTLLTNTKGEFKKSVIFNGIKIDYGTGGAHACIRPGVYKSTDSRMILDLDADALYPSLAINQGLYPEHLGPGFLHIYNNEIVAKRLAEKRKPKKERDFVIVEGFKLAANGFYGKSNSDDSYAYDPLYSMKTTISGQIMISMWIEKLVKAVSNLQIIQINTDGISIIIDRKDYDKVILITEEITKITGLTFECNEYIQMVVRDVNNYSCKKIDGNMKYTGTFEINPELHKDPSMRIVPLALSKYFYENIPIVETLINHEDIYDFCLRLKVNKGWKAGWNFINNEQCLETQWLSKNTRYYISNHGGSLIKKNTNDGRVSGVSVGYITTPFNKYIKKDMKDYDINYKFYIKECNKIICQIESGQIEIDWDNL